MSVGGPAAKRQLPFGSSVVVVVDVAVVVVVVELPQSNENDLLKR